MATPGHRDPRSIVTPDAFEVSKELLGMPLAGPSQRAAALAIDGVVIAALTAFTKSFSLIIGVIAAALFLRAGFRRTPVRGSVFGRAMRFSVGCLGLLIAVVTAALWSSFGIGFDREGAREEAARAVTARTGQVLQGLEAAVALEGLEQAGGPEDALAVANEVMPLVRDLGLPEDLIRDALLAGVPDSASWRGEWEAIVDSLVQADAVAPAAQPALESTDAAAAREEIASYSLEEVVGAYGALVSEPPGAETDALRLGLLRERLVDAFAGDSLEALATRAARLERQRDRLEGDLGEARQELAEAASRGIVQKVFDLADDLGFGFGWAAIYMTVMLTWWKGQTVGKRIMRIRVLRLDGGTITWWVAFERVGGYAAGLATGLLGFAQIWWDANRQAIHDRIVGTVVVRDEAEKVLDWESSL